jgi:hypothetical protein
MSVTAGNILQQTRRYLKDIGKTQYADWEIYQGINDALRLFAEESARAYDGGGLFSGSTTLTLTNGAVALPADYIKIKRAYAADGTELLRVFDHNPDMGEIAINGNSITSGETSLKLDYYNYSGTVSTETDTVNMPVSMLMPLAKIAAYCIAGGDSSSVQIAQYFSGKTTLASSTSSNSQEASA